MFPTMFKPSKSKMLIYNNFIHIFLCFIWSPVAVLFGETSDDTSERGREGEGGSWLL